MNTKKRRKRRGKKSKCHRGKSGKIQTLWAKNENWFNKKQLPQTETTRQGFDGHINSKIWVGKCHETKNNIAHLLFAIVILLTQCLTLFHEVLTWVCPLSPVLAGSLILQPMTARGSDCSVVLWMRVCLWIKQFVTKEAVNPLAGTSDDFSKISFSN